jgi:glycosyltransferase involved in cell wall biosynthesis
MRRVGYVTTTFPTLAAFVEAEVAGLVDRGHRVTVFALRPTSALFQPEHARLLALVRHVGGPFAPRSWAAAARLIARRPLPVARDVLGLLGASLGDAYALAGHLGYLPAACAVAEAARRERIERLHGAWAHFPATVAYLAARWSGARFSFSAHAGADLYRSTAFLANKLRAADFVATCVQGNLAHLRALAPEAAPRLHCIYHGVDLTRFSGDGREPAPGPLFLSVGALRAAKGFADAVRAVGLLRDQGLRVDYVLVGDGAERGALESLVAELGVGEQVRFAGSLDHAALLPHYRRAWALLAPSVVLASGRRDGIPNVVVEAMAMGLPCVATRAAGLAEAVEHGANGLLVPPRDPGALAAAMRLVVEDRAEAERMGRAGRARAAERFDAARSFERLRALFECPAVPPPPAGGTAT